MKKRFLAISLIALCGACVINKGHALEQDIKQPGYYPLLSAGIVRLTRLPDNPLETDILSIQQYFVDQAMKKYDTVTREKLVNDFFAMDARFSDVQRHPMIPLNETLNRYLGESRKRAWYDAVRRSCTQTNTLIHTYEIEQWNNAWALDLDDLK